ncbi:geraniol 8-hydroxylase-like [Euphorbia lathyris]|uniref:geraniol 8-hydroxylase-like n=1 Tax=Euphorbia lathyris TaxID=212925 RepID=UPI0033138FEC
MAPISSFNENLGTISPSIYILILCPIFAFLWYTYTNSTKGSSRLPPGPPGLPLIGNLASLDPELHSYFAALSHKYGPILKLRLGFKLGIIITCPSLAGEVLKEHDITFANRDVPDVARSAAYSANDIVWTPYGPQWRLLRKVCVLNMLNNATLDSVYSLRRHEVRGTVSYMYSQAGLPVDFGEQIFLSILNVITNMLWGGTVQGEERANLGKEFRKVIAEMTEILASPNVSDFFPGLVRFDLQGLRKQMDIFSNQFEGIFERMIEKRLKMDSAGESGEDNKDFLQFLLKLRDQKDAKTPLTMTHLKALLTDMIVGGTSTSSNAIEFVMAEMINKPEEMRKAQQELDTVIGKNNIVEENHIHQLPYLYAIMKETLRLHPTLPLLVPHCPSETCTVGGYTIPKGARVFVNVWAIHRDPSIWENPLEFKLERFLDSKWDYSGNDFSYFPFGSGRRICAGIAMAERMYLYSLATLLHSFDWNSLQRKNVDLTEKFGIVMKLKNPLIVIPTPRLSDPTLYH